MRCTKDKPIQLLLPLVCPICKKGNILVCPCESESISAFREVEKYLGRVRSMKKKQK